MKKIIVLNTLVLFSLNSFSQNPTISPQVINSAGDHRQLGATGIYITDNVGEPFTETLGGSVMITQGFIQPEVVSLTGFSVNVKVITVTCLDKQDGEIHIEVKKASSAVNYQVAYTWMPTGVCAGTNCDSLKGLIAQTYTVDMVITYTNTVGSVKTETLSRVIPVAGSNELCKIKIYSGITANNDGNNDVMTIDNIEEFPKNRLMVYNRWGTQIADIKGYNNSTNGWPTKDKLDNLVPSTYFYILDLGDGSKLIKGWVELIKN